ncbi:aconitase X [Aliamphritea spongicola]|nr:aconitase X [Aliamphritea spongicola]
MLIRGTGAKPPGRSHGQLRRSGPVPYRRCNPGSPSVSRLTTSGRSDQPGRSVTDSHPDNIAEQPLDLVVTGAPQMCWSEVLELHEKLANKLIHPDVTFLAFTDKGSLDCATSLGVTSELRASGCRLLDGIDFFQSGSEPMRKNNGWKTALTPSPSWATSLTGQAIRPVQHHWIPVSRQPLPAGLLTSH